MHSIIDITMVGVVMVLVVVVGGGGDSPFGHQHIRSTLAAASSKMNPLQRIQMLTFSKSQQLPGGFAFVEPSEGKL